MENLINQCEAGAQAFQWSSLVGPLLALLGVLATIVYGLNTTRRNLRVNVLSTSRLKWLELLRDEIANLLIHGELLYSPIDTGNADAIAAERRSLTAVSKKLVVLLGREDPQRFALAEIVRKFASAPDKHLADRIEVLSQKVFRAQWNKVRTETGQPERDKAPLERPPDELVDVQPTLA